MSKFQITVNNGQEIIVNYALYSSGHSFINSFILTNYTNNNYEEIYISAQLSNNYSRILITDHFFLEARSKIDIASLLKNRFVLETKCFENQTEKQKGYLEVKVISASTEEMLHEQSFPVDFYAIDEWSGAKLFPETLAAFITPNDEAVQKVVDRTSKILKERGQEELLEGYQSQKKERIVEFISACYTALREEQIVYTDPKKFFAMRQRIRMPYEVLTQKKGTCLDLSVLYCACLEALDLNPVLILIEGHAFVGCFLENNIKFDKYIVEDYNTVCEKILAKDLILINAVDFCSGVNHDFKTAKDIGENYFSPERFKLAIDVSAVHMYCVSPLNTSTTMAKPKRQYNLPKVEEEAPKLNLTPLKSKELDSKASTVFEQWQKDLISYSGTNPLLRLPRGSLNISIANGRIDVNDVAKQLFEGKSFEVNYKLADYTYVGGIDYQTYGIYNNYLSKNREDKVNIYEVINRIEQLKDEFEQDQYGKNILFVDNALPEYILDDADKVIIPKIHPDERFKMLVDRKLQKSRENLERTIVEHNEIINESGTNTLFLGLGVMQWYNVRFPVEEYAELSSDNERNAFLSKFRQENMIEAPVLLIPITLEKAGNSYKIYCNEHFISLNINLFELLSSNYEIDFSKYYNINAGFDKVSFVFDIITNEFKEKSKTIDDPNVKIIYELTNVRHGMVVGSFPVDKVQIWEDLRSQKKRFADNYIINSLLHTERMWEDRLDIINEDNVEDYDVLMPQPSDTYQTIAIANAIRGNNFILQGPPGTGKSQTISNIIANALYHGQKVLFVTEKRSALEVVYSRLKNIGLAQYCLPLHSELVRQEDIIRRIDNETNIKRELEGKADFEKITEKLRKLRQKLRGTLKAMTQKHECGYSVLELANKCVSCLQYEKTDALDYLDLKQLSEEVFDKWHKLIRRYANFYEVPDRLESLKLVEKQIEEEGLNSYLEVLKTKCVDTKDWEHIFRSDLYRALLKQIIEDNDILYEYRDFEYKDFVSDFEILQKKYEGLCSHEICRILDHNINKALKDKVYSDELTVLKAQSVNKAPLRETFFKAQNLLKVIYPCYLMNNLSVPIYISREAPPFDLVIFDEASMIPCCEAVSAILRGSTIVVAGDEKQAPPPVTSEEDKLVESLLDSCIKTFSSSRIILKNHYRSQHASLIDFSNATYYKPASQELNVYPSVDDISRVSLIQLSGNSYNFVAKTNKEEAEAVVKELIRRTKVNPKNQDSYGVIAFTENQGKYIQRMLKATLALDEYKANEYQSLLKRTFFKNIDNVQGDEADVILISLTFGRDNEGELPNNFESLSNKKGHNLLNVAVSRSRKEMLVFTTLTDADLEVVKNYSTGVKDLYKFTNYIKHPNSLVYEESSLFENDLEQNILEDIAAVIEKEGYKVEYFYGDRNTKVDLAVFDKNSFSKRYLLGINIYDNSGKELSAYDVFVTKAKLLKENGWALKCFWALDFVNNREEILKEIKDEIKIREKEIGKIKKYSFNAMEIKEQYKYLEIDSKVDLLSDRDNLITYLSAVGFEEKILKKLTDDELENYYYQEKNEARREALISKLVALGYDEDWIMGISNEQLMAEFDKYRKKIEFLKDGGEDIEKLEGLSIREINSLFEERIEILQELENMGYKSEDLFTKTTRYLKALLNDLKNPRNISHEQPQKNPRNVTDSTSPKSTDEVQTKEKKGGGGFGIVILVLAALVAGYMFLFNGNPKDVANNNKPAASTSNTNVGTSGRSSSNVSYQSTPQTVNKPSNPQPSANPQPNTVNNVKTKQPSVQPSQPDKKPAMTSPAPASPTVSNRTVYVTINKEGSLWHNSRSCTHGKNAKPISLNKAIAGGYSQCPYCK